MNADGIILFYVVSKCLYLRQLHKTKKTDDNSRLLCILLIQAEGTGFEPADTLRYRQFSKLLV